MSWAHYADDLVGLSTNDDVISTASSSDDDEVNKEIISINSTATTLATDRDDDGRIVSFLVWDDDENAFITRERAIWSLGTHHTSQAMKPVNALVVCLLLQRAHPTVLAVPT